LLPFCNVPHQGKKSEVYVQIITVKTQAELDHTLALLHNGQDFAEVARIYSTHSTAQGGGIWGPLRLDELPLEVRRQIEKSADGDLVQFFHPNLGFAILRSLDTLAAKKAVLELVLTRGATHLQRNEKQEALKELRSAVALDPRSGPAHQLLGQAYLTQGTYEAIGEAKSEFVQALALNPDLIWARFYLARIYLDLGNAERAKEELELGLRTRPNVPHLLSLLGEANRKLGNAELSAEQNKKALEAAMLIFEVTKTFPKAETYSLTDQVRRSSRSVCANLAEAWRKRRYEAAFASKLSDSEAEAAETQTWLEFAVKCGYLNKEKGRVLFKIYDELIAILVTMINHPDSWVLPSGRKQKGR